MNVQETIWGLESIQKDVLNYESESIKEAIRLLKEQESEIEKLRFTIKTVIDLQLDFSQNKLESNWSIKLPENFTEKMMAKIDKTKSKDNPQYLEDFTEKMMRKRNKVGEAKDD